MCTLYTFSSLLECSSGGRLSTNACCGWRPPPLHPPLPPNLWNNPTANNSKGTAAAQFNTSDFWAYFYSSLLYQPTQVSSQPETHNDPGSYCDSTKSWWCIFYAKQSNQNPPCFWDPLVCMIWWEGPVARSSWLPHIIKGSSTSLLHLLTLSVLLTHY